MTRVLVIVDIQRDYFPGGAYPLVGADAAAERAAVLLDSQRAAGAPVIHVRHESEPGAGMLVAGSPGGQIDARVAPLAGETVVPKKHPNAFLETPLQGLLVEAAASEVLVIGMQSSMCVDATVRAASDLGFVVTVAADACAAPDLEFAGRTIGGADVHTAFMAALAAGYADVTGVDELVA